VSNKKKIAILILGYNVADTLVSVLDRIPQEIKDRVEEIFVLDDCSTDNTAQVGEDYKKKHKLSKLHIYRNKKNLGYGGNQKKGYTYAIKKGYDIVVMLHGDGQYAPEELPRLLKPLEEGKADMVFGSRMTGDPLKGGMPFYKYLGNKFLTTIENILLGTNLSEFHSGYRIYNMHALKKVPFEKCSNYYSFDTDIIIQLIGNNLRIVELPIPTHYGKEISYLNCFTYGFKVLGSVMDYKMHTWGLSYVEKFDFKKLN